MGEVTGDSRHVRRTAPQGQGHPCTMTAHNPLRSRRMRTHLRRRRRRLQVPAAPAQPVPRGKQAELLAPLRSCLCGRVGVAQYHACSSTTVRAWSTACCAWPPFHSCTPAWAGTCRLGARHAPAAAAAAFLLAASSSAAAAANWDTGSPAASAASPHGHGQYGASPCPRRCSSLAIVSLPGPVVSVALSCRELSPKLAHGAPMACLQVHVHVLVLWCKQTNTHGGHALNAHAPRERAPNRFDFDNLPRGLPRKSCFLYVCVCVCPRVQAALSMPPMPPANPYL